MKTPRLVVMTGYPCAGKTQIANYFADQLGFTKFSTDDMRFRLFKVKDYAAFQQDPYFEHKEQILGGVIQSGKVGALANGMDVVIDFSAYDAERRKAALDTRYDLIEIAAEKYLVFLRVDKTVLRVRNIRKRRINDVVGEWDAVWQAPEKGKGFSLITYDNNRIPDLDTIMRDVERRFRRAPERRPTIINVQG